MHGSVMLMLRDGTAADHASAERQPFQRALAAGAATRGAYIAYLGQLLPVHETLEAQLEGCGDAAVGRIVTADQRRAHHLRADLETLGASPPVALPATAALVASLRTESEAAALLGSLYVLEGSKNGAAFIARAVRRSLELEPGRGDRYLDPHGAAQRQVWGAFKTRMEREPWDPEQRDGMLRAAGAMFRAIEAISAELEKDFLAATAT